MNAQRLGAIRITLLLISFSSTIFSTYCQVLFRNDQNLVNPSSLAKSIDFESFKREMANEGGLSVEEGATFFNDYAWDWFSSDKAVLIEEIKSGIVTNANLADRLVQLKTKYLHKVADFRRYQTELKEMVSQNVPQLRLEVANGPCTNMGFEDGTFSGWSGSVQDRNVGNNNNNPIPGPLINGFGQHCIMTPVMRDPYVANLSVVPPGKNRSLRLGNVVPGGHIAKVRQTFLVTPNNVVFTYRYAVVLEDPNDSQQGHEGLNSPHFSANLITATGDTIDCSKYSVVVSNNLASYTHLCVDAGDGSTIRNSGCPRGATGSDNTNGPNVSNVTIGPVVGNCGRNIRDFYYRDWSTVAIVLDQYLGQNVTIEFAAADCVPNGHLGYAYVQAECSPLSRNLPGFICSGRETKYVNAPDGFASYAWTVANGGSIVGPSNGQYITIATAGTYKVRLFPKSDLSASCPYEITYVVQNRCAIEKVFCETRKGSKETDNVNLTAFNQEVTGNVSTSQVTSWHTGLPATSINRIGNPTIFTVKDSGLYYAVLKDASVKDDTVMLLVRVKPKPSAAFNELPIFCKSTSPFTITSTSPGGVFSGQYVTANGIFTPSSVGLFDIKYRIVNSFGCIDSVIKKAAVQELPTINALGDTTVCYQNSVLDLPLRSSASSSDSIVWTSSFGVIANNKLPATRIRLQQTAPFERKVKVYVTSFRKACPPAKDSVTLEVRQLPSLALPDDTMICSSTSPVSLVAKAKVSFQESIRWKGNNVSFVDLVSPQTSVAIPYAYPQKAQTKILLEAYKQSCPVVKDSFVVAINPAPKVTVANDSSYCASINVIPLWGTAVGSDSVGWKVKNLIGAFSDPLAPNTVFSKPTSLDTAAATFILTAFTKGCGTVSDSLRAFFSPLPSLALSADSAVCENNPIIQAQALVKKAKNVIWEGEAIQFTPNQTSKNVQYLPSSLELGKGIVTLKASTARYEGQLCPSAKDSVQIKIYSAPEVDIKDTTLCGESKTSILLHAKSKDADSLVWYSSLSLQPRKGPSTTLKDLSTSNSAKVLVAAYKKGCRTVSDSMTLTYVASPQISLPRDTCFYQPIRIMATVLQKPPLGVYYWQREGKRLIDTSLSLILDKVSSYSYHYEFNGCKSSDTIRTLAPPQLSIVVPPACENSSIRLDANKIEGGKYTWGSVVSTSPFYTVSVGKGIDNFPVRVIDVNGCKDTFIVKIPVSPYPSFQLKWNPLCLGENGQISAFLDNESLSNTHAISYQWSKSGQVIATDKWQNLAYQSTGKYTLVLKIKECEVKKTVDIVSLPQPRIDIPLEYKYCYETQPNLELVSNTFHKYVWLSEEGLIDTVRSIKVAPHKDTPYYLKVSNEFGCKDSVKVLVRKVCPPRLFVPNVITPASNDVNAGLAIFGAHYTNFEITIFSRWGEVIFNSKDPQNIWNGVYNNENMPIGTYPWVVTYEGDSEEYKGPYKKVGEVTVVR